ncbi:MAG: helix-turn-helix domain-containing protein [Christensenellaceae bacterium]|nr:helix-turn-helix domain-containing protein [Christensenellaceae bacterium]
MRISEVLRRRIRIMNGKQRIIAEKLGINETTLSAKLNGHRRLYADEFRDICQVLSLNADDILKESMREE